MTSVFLDANIFLDVFAKREPYYQYSAQILSLIDRQQLTGYTSSLNFSNLFYIIHKQQTRELAIKYLRQLASFIKILAVDEQIIDFALHSNFKDFEDAIQYYTAKSNKIQFLITHNLRDYLAADMKIIQVVTAEEFLNYWKTTSI